MNFKNYKIREFYYGGEIYDTEYTLPEVKWYKDHIAGAVGFAGAYNYIAIVEKTPEIEEWAGFSVSSLDVIDLDNICVLYMENVCMLEENTVEFVPEIVFPSDLYILKMDMNNPGCPSIIKPIRYFGGGECLAITWSKGVGDFAWMERTNWNISNYNTDSSFSEMNVISKHYALLYAAGIEELIKTGQCNIDFDYITLLSDDIKSSSSIDESSIEEYIAIKTGKKLIWKTA